MPRIFGGQDARKAFKKGKPDLAKENTVCYLQILGIGTDCDDASPSVLLFFDRQRYLFNAGEGFQRFCVEHKVKMNRMSSCLLTRLDGHASGGLPGMCLTMADAGVPGPSQKPQLDLIGPKGTNQLANSIRSFISMNAVGINALEFGGAGAGLKYHNGVEKDGKGALLPVVENEILTIFPVMLTSKFDESQKESSKNEEELNGHKGFLEPLAKKAKTEQKETDTLPESTNGTSMPISPGPNTGFTVNGPIVNEPGEKLSAASYICELSRVPGRFLPDKAIELGVPKGEAFAILKNWKPYTLEDGSIVQPDQVNEPYHPGPVAAIVDCPDLDYLPSLVRDPAWERFYTESEHMDNYKPVDIMCHLASANVAESEEYKAWSSKFGQNTHHVFVNSKANKATPIMTSSAVVQARLNCLHPKIFPLHKYPDSTGPEGEDHPMEGEPVLLTSDSVEKEHVAVPERIKIRPNKESEAGQTDPVSDEPLTIDSAKTEPKLENDHTSTAEATEIAKGEQIVSVKPPTRMKVQAFRVKEKFIAGQNLLKFHMRPPSRKGCFDLGDVPEPTDFEGIRERVTSNEDLMADLNLALENGQGVATSRGHSGNDVDHTIQNIPQKGSDTKDHLVEASGDDFEIDHNGIIKKIGNESLEITFLGTGAAIPSKYRNVTGIYLSLFARGGMLVDCGEGSFGQLKRRFGEGIWDVIRNLRCAWVSHIHADHHAGLTRILALRRQLLGSGCPPLLVFGPRPLHRVLMSSSQLQPLACHYVCNSTTVYKHPGPKEDYNKKAIKDALTAMNISTLESYTVDHCANAYGLNLVSHDGWKLVFSGDTRPCLNVVQAARDAQVLIHEATFEDALEEEAINKRHSLTREAVEVGHKAKAYRTLLTHFSQRYPKIPVVEPSFRTTTCIAFDLMTFNLTDLPMLPWLVQPISHMFQADSIYYRDLEAEQENAQAEQLGNQDTMGRVLDKESKGEQNPVPNPNQTPNTS